MTSFFPAFPGCVTDIQREFAKVSNCKTWDDQRYTVRFTDAYGNCGSIPATRFKEANDIGNNLATRGIKIWGIWNNLTQDWA